MRVVVGARSRSIVVVVVSSVIIIVTAWAPRVFVTSSSSIRRVRGVVGRARVVERGTCVVVVLYIVYTT